MAVLLALMPAPAFAQFLCGSTNVFEKNTEWMREISRKAGFSYLLGDNEVQCGLPGEDFRVCRKCETTHSEANHEGVKPMFARDTYKIWQQRRTSEYAARAVKVSDTDFKTEQLMGHVRGAEDREKYEKRVNQHWGESFLFSNRKLLKMLYLELTLDGKPCVGPLDRLPLKWNDKTWPAPGGASVQAKLDRIQQDIKTLEAPGVLKSMTLSRLGQEMVRLHDSLTEVYTGGKADHANRYAWMINAHLDTYVGKWLKAHGFEQIAASCATKPRCYEWQGTYTATYPY